MPLDYPADLTKGRSRQPYKGGVFKDFAPTLAGFKANAAIGFKAGYQAEDYPKAPEREPFKMLMMVGEQLVEEMALGSIATDMANAQKYAGFSETSAKITEPITCRVAGQVWIPCGVQSITYGNLVSPAFDPTGANVAGDVIPFKDPATTDSPLTDACHHQTQLVGRAVTSATARVDATNFEPALVVLRGY